MENKIEIEDIELFKKIMQKYEVPKDQIPRLIRGDVKLFRSDLRQIPKVFRKEFNSYKNCACITKYIYPNGEISYKIETPARFCREFLGQRNSIFGCGSTIPKAKAEFIKALNTAASESQEVITTAELAAERHAKVYKTEEEMTKPAEGGYFAINLPVEESGIFRRGWNHDELDAVTVVCKRQTDVESGTLAVVSMKGDSKAFLKRVYKNSNGFVLEAPENFDKPDEHIPPIALTIGEVKETLTILGKVVQFSFALANRASKADT